MKVSKREVTMLAVLFIFICGFLYYQFYFKAVQAELAELAAEIETQESTLSSLRVMQTRLEGMKTDLEKRREDADEKLKNVLPAIDQPIMLDMISNTIKDLSGESTMSFPRDYQQLDYSKIYTAPVKFQTNYASLKELLTAFENAPYVNRIVYANISSSGSKTYAGNVNLADNADLEGDADLEDEEQNYSLAVNLNVEFFTLDELPSDNNPPFLTGEYPNREIMP